MEATLAPSRTHGDSHDGSEQIAELCLQSAEKYNRTSTGPSGHMSVPSLPFTS
jgi:hypothetical protein